MNPNLNRTERIILDEFQRRGAGKAWLTRPMLWRCLQNRATPIEFGVRTLDLALRRLEKWRVVSRTVTQDHGAVYALPSHAQAYPCAADPLRRYPLRALEGLGIPLP